MAPEVLVELINYLDENLGHCDRTRRLSEQFLANEDCDLDAAAAWFDESSANCDCEIANNLYDFAMTITHVPERSGPPPNQENPKEKPPARDLTILPGWDFAALPSPWKIANLYRDEEPLRLQLGKKDVCTVSVMMGNARLGLKSDQFWIRKWIAATNSQYPADFEVLTDRLEKPDLDSVIVKTDRWIPVVGWFYDSNEDFHFQMRSELARFKGDLKEVTKLLAAINQAEPQQIFGPHPTQGPKEA